MQGHILERAADGGIYALPGAAHAAQPFDSTLARGAAALGMKG